MRPHTLLISSLTKKCINLIYILVISSCLFSNIALAQAPNSSTTPPIVKGATNMSFADAQTSDMWSKLNPIRQALQAACLIGGFIMLIVTALAIKNGKQWSQAWGELLGTVLFFLAPWLIKWLSDNL